MLGVRLPCVRIGPMAKRKFDLVLEVFIGELEFV